MTPHTVSSPAFIAIQLTVVSGDGQRHRVVLATPNPYSVVVPASGRASLRVPGLRAGRYVLDVDGVARGALVIGGEPGP